MSNRLEIIGLCGVARSGKDTAAKCLELDHGFMRVALGDGLRGAFWAIDGPSWELTKELELAGVTSRWGLQTLGTEAREALTIGGAHRYLWIDLLLVGIRYLAFHHPRP
jgi:hypothetical protein